MIASLTYTVVYVVIVGITVAARWPGSALNGQKRTSTCRRPPLNPSKVTRIRHLLVRSRSYLSGQLHGPVVIAMITMRMVQPTVHEIVDMIAMRHLFMSAVWTVCV